MDESAVKEVARMQSLIDEYEQVIKSLWATATTCKEYNPIKICNTEFDNEINELFKFVKEKNLEEKIRKGFEDNMRATKANEERLIADLKKNGADVSWYYRLKDRLGIKW